MKYTLIISMILCSILVNAQQKYTISGYLSDLESGEKLISANILDLNSEKGTVTNLYGFYSLTLPMDSVTLAFTYVGYGTIIKQLYLNKDINLNVDLDGSVNLDVVEVKAERVNRIEEQSQMSKVSLPIEQIKKLPALLGEVDVLKAIQLLPGVQSGGEGQTGLYVRGGSPDQNLILLDGVPVYNVSHVLGIFSVFNADAIKNISLTKGGYPARFGGRLSSILEINLKDGDMNKFKGEGSLGIISSKLTLEGPIIKDKMSFIISGRRTYLDILARPLINLANGNSDEKISPRLFFYDLNAKLNYKFNDVHRLYLSAYSGADVFKFKYSDEFEKIESGLEWGNLISSLRWNYKINDRLFSNVTGTYSNYDLDVGTSFEELDLDEPEKFSALYISGIEDLGFKWDLDFIPLPDHYIKFGISATHHTYRPGALTLKFKAGQDEQKLKIGSDDQFSVEYDAYVEDDFKWGRFKTNIGLHYSAFDVKDEFYHSLQPRFSTRYLLTNDIALKGSFAVMTQYINLLTSESLTLPTDLWVPSTKRIKPQRSWQIAIGAAKTFKEEYEISIEGYYKKMDNVLSYRPGSSFLLGLDSDWQEKVVQGEGTAYGAEFLIQKKTGKLNGWVGYTLSWNNRQFDEINGGNIFPYRYDRRHDLSIVMNYDLTDKISFSGAWVFGTGNAVSLPIFRYDIPRHFTNTNGSGIFNNSNEINGSGSKNAFRMSDFHRLDLSVSFHKKKKRYERTWVIGVYNAYWHKNPYFIFPSTESYYLGNGQKIEKTVFKEVSILPIIPSISYQFKF